MYLYALPITLFMRYILVKQVEPGQGAIVLLSWKADFLDGIK